MRTRSDVFDWFPYGDDADENADEKNLEKVLEAVEEAVAVAELYGG